VLGSPGAQADDLGWNDLGHFNGGLTLTKSIDGLIATGVLLERFHTFKVCAPSRASTMSGRYPFNVGFYEMPKDDANQCLSNTTLLPALLRSMGYSTHALGKWDVGYIAKVCTPTHSGFETFLGYYEACNHDLFYHTCGKCSPQTCGRTDGNGTATAECEVDFSLNVGVQGAIQGAPVELNGTYSSRAFSARAKSLIASHNSSKPLYMYIAPQNVHLGCGPNKATQGIQAPCETVTLYPNVPTPFYLHARRTIAQILIVHACMFFDSRTGRWSTTRTRSRAQ
jgi:hypothetical protein